MRRGTLIVLIGLVFVGAFAGGLWWWRHQRIPPRANVSEFENDMTEGLVRGVLRELGRGGPPVCFLAFGEGQTPASPGFVERFAGTYPAVKSSGSSVAPPIGKYFDVSSGRPGMILRVIRFKEFIPTQFDVLIAFSNLPSGRDRFIYRIANQGGDWVILSRKPE